MTTSHHTLNANDLKVSGVTAIECALGDAPEAFISVRGDPRYVVMRVAHYDYLRDRELEAAWLATQADVASGRAKTMTSAEHIADMQYRLRETSQSAHMVQETRKEYVVKTKPRKKTA